MCRHGDYMYRVSCFYLLLQIDEDDIDDVGEMKK